jgi:hypothetical protein
LRRARSSRFWTTIFVTIAALLGAAGIVGYLEIFADNAQGTRNQATLVLLFGGAHSHFGIIMLIGLAIVAVVSFGLFRLLVRGKESGNRG